MVKFSYQTQIDNARASSHPAVKSLGNKLALAVLNHKKALDALTRQIEDTKRDFEDGLHLRGVPTTASQVANLADATAEINLISFLLLDTYNITMVKDDD